MLKKAFVFTLCAAALVTGCTSGITVKRGEFAHMELEPVLKNSRMNLKLVRFADNRRPESLAHDTEQNVIYEYTPDKILQGVVPHLQSIFQRYLTGARDNSEDVFLEVELKHIRTVIRTGRMFTGRGGEYQVEMEVRAIARHGNSKVFMDEKYTAESFERRELEGGRHPSIQQDRKNMLLLVERTTHDLLQQIASKARRKM